MRNNCAELAALDQVDRLNVAPAQQSVSKTGTQKLDLKTFIGASSNIKVKFKERDFGFFRQRTKLIGLTRLLNNS